MLLKCCTQYVSKFGKLISGHRTGERSIFISIPTKDNVKECFNYCATAPISNASKVMLKILQARLQQYLSQELPDVQAGFQRGIGIRDQITNIHWILEKASEFQRNIYFCFFDYTKTFDYVDHNKLCEILKEMRVPDHLTCLWRNLYPDQEVTESDMEQWTGSKLGKEYIKAVYCHPTYLTPLQSISCEMPGWMKLKLESRLLEEISTTPDMEMTQL